MLEPSFDTIRAVLDPTISCPVAGVLAYVAKCKDGRVRRWWSHVTDIDGSRRLRCNVCEARFDVYQHVEEHKADHVFEAEIVLAKNLFPVSSCSFGVWESRIGSLIPHRMYFNGVPCVSYAVYRLASLHGLVSNELLQKALDRVDTDDTFGAAIEAAAHVPQGITTLLQSQLL